MTSRKPFWLQAATRLARRLTVIAFTLAAVESSMLWARPSPAAFARPSEILRVLPNFLSLSGAGLDVAATSARTLAALLIALPLGLAFGLVVAKMRWIRAEGQFLLDFLRSIPATALVPLFLVIFGLGNESKIAAGAFSGSLAIAVAALVGYNGLNAQRARVADRIGLRGLQRILFYEIPEIAPALFVGLRTAASLCLILVIVAEMFIGSTTGLGRIIMDRRYSDDVPTLYAAIVVSGLVGFALNQLFLLAEKRLRAALGSR